MQNVIDDKMLATINSDFKKIKDKLRNISVIIQDHQEYNNPIFVATSDEMDNFFPLLIRKGEFDNEEHYYVTYFDNLVKLSIIDKNRVEDFITNYKNPKYYCCILCLNKVYGKSGYVYIPY